MRIYNKILELNVQLLSLCQLDDIDICLNSQTSNPMFTIIFSTYFLNHTSPPQFRTVVDHPEHLCAGHGPGHLQAEPGVG